MWVDYLWTTLVTEWAQALDLLWETGHNRPTELNREGPDSEALWKPPTAPFRTPGRFEPPIGSWPTPACPRYRCSGAWSGPSGACCPGSSRACRGGARRR